MIKYISLEVSLKDPMVLEAIINPNKLSNKWELFFIGVFYSFLAVFLSLWVFKQYASIVMITFTIIASIPFVSKIMEKEEIKDMKNVKEWRLLKEHTGAVTMMMYLFLGYVVAFGILYIFLPAAQSQLLFGVQLDTITKIMHSPTGNFYSVSALGTIFMNNLRILFLCVIFSFLFGAGAIFILTWNASVMAAAIGSFIKFDLLNNVGTFGYIQATFMGLMRYLIHGIPEISAYFIGALAGGILSAAIIKKHYKKRGMKTILRDSVDLIAISVVVLLISAVIEVFVTPIFV